MAGLIPREFIDQIIESSDVVAIINDYVTLSKSGTAFKACCPFHSEKTPSFFVNPQKQFYHCFGCGVSGNVVSFLMENQGMSFVESIEYLAARQGVDVPRTQSDSHNEADQQLKAEQQSLRELHDTASRYFRWQWKNNPNAALAVDYLKHRQISGEIAREFQLGLAPDGWQGLAALLQDYKPNLLESSGLLGKRNSGDFFDRFRARIMFPIWDVQGRTIAFGGRVYGNGEPKYLNSPETPIFHKSKVLYALNKAREHIRRQDRVVIVEGYMDVVMLAQFDIRNAVATLGTAITEEHITALFRITPNITFCLDGDRAGRVAAWRGLQIALPQMEDGRSISFLFLKDGKDPDDTVKEIGADKFISDIENAEPMDKVFFDHFLKQYDVSRLDQKAGLFKEARALLQKMPTGAYRKLMFEQLSTISGMSAKAVPSVTPRQQAFGRNTQHRFSLAMNIGAALVHSPDLVEAEDDWTRFISLQQQDVDTLLNIVEAFKKHQPANTAMAMNALQYEGLGDFNGLLNAVPRLDDAGVKDWFLAKKDQLEQNLLSQRFKELERRVSEGEASVEDIEELTALKRRQIGRQSTAN